MLIKMKNLKERIKRTKKTNTRLKKKKTKNRAVCFDLCVTGPKEGDRLVYGVHALILAATVAEIVFLIGEV